MEIELTKLLEAKQQLQRIGNKKEGGGKPEAEDKMQSGLFLNVVVRESATIFKLLAGEDQSLLVGRNAFLVLKSSKTRMR